MPRSRRRPRLADASHGEEKLHEEKLHEEKLHINQEFAVQYESRKRRELLSRTPAELLEEDEEESDEEEEVEDEHAELLTKKLDTRISETVKMLRRNDPRIYDPKVKFFDDSESEEEEKQSDGRGSEEEGKSGGENAEESEESVSAGDEPVVGWDFLAAKDREAMSKPKMKLKDYVRETLLKDGRLSDSDNDIGEEKTGESRNIETTKNVSNDLRPMDKDVGDNIQFKDSEGEEDASDVEFFTKKRDSQFDLVLDSKQDKLSSDAARSKSRFASQKADMHAHLMAPEDEKDRFLRDFVLNNGWLEGNSANAPNVALDDVGISEDEDEVNAAENFETQYNFRFEDPEATGIKTHARFVEGSMRRVDERRRKARKSRKARKEAEKQQKSEEIKRLKKEKRLEIEARLSAIREAAGDDLGFGEKDLDDDFDPEEFSRAMERKFNDEYYSKEDRKLAEEMESGQCSASSRVCDDNDMKEKVTAMIDEYYELGYEDIIGGEPVRFRYKKVDPELFQMSPEMILNSDDKELNRLVSLKYIAPYRMRSEIPKRMFKKIKRASFAKNKGQGATEGSHDPKGTKRSSR